MLRFKKLFFMTILALSLITSAAASNDTRLSVNQALQLAQDEKVILVDVRSRDEWRETGIASVAYPVSMHENDFLPRFQSILELANGRPVALICATGSRTAWLQQELNRRGVKNILDVSEGMLGSRHGQGWLRSGLPILKYPPTATSRSAPGYSWWESLTGSYAPSWKQQEEKE